MGQMSNLVQSHCWVAKGRLYYTYETQCYHAGHLTGHVFCKEKVGKSSYELIPILINKLETNDFFTKKVVILLYIYIYIILLYIYIYKAAR